MYPPMDSKLVRRHNEYAHEVGHVRGNVGLAETCGAALKTIRHASAGPPWDPVLVVHVCPSPVLAQRQSGIDKTARNSTHAFRILELGLVSSAVGSSSLGVLQFRVQAREMWRLSAVPCVQLYLCVGSLYRTLLFVRAWCVENDDFVVFVVFIRVVCVENDDFVVFFVFL